MKLRAEQLATQLQSRAAAGLAPLYLVSGDEPFQVDEACRQLRVAALAQGYSERQVLHGQRNFDWQSVGASADALSLFAQKRLIELRLSSNKPGDEGSKALQAYAARPPDDTLLLIVCPKLESAQQQSKWFKALDQAGVIVQIWPIEAARLPGWLRQRMSLRDMTPSDEALAMLAERVEGNLLAADQELEKLRLLSGGGRIEAEQVAAAVTDSARYDVFSLVDSALSGAAPRALRMLHGLRGEGQEPLVLLWALARELRQLAAMATALEAGQSLAAVLQSHRVWDKRKPVVSQALQRYPRAAPWQAMLQHCSRLDRVCKGQMPGGPWDELIQLISRLAGIPLFQVRS